MMDATPGCDVTLRGEIVAGDAEKLAEALGEFDTLCLDSPGGRYAEALRFIELMSTSYTGFRAVVGDGARCLSACALMFLAGSQSVEGNSFPWRSLHIRGELGFHGPFVRLPETTFTSDQIEQSYQAGVRAIAKLLQTGSPQLFPISLLSQALAVGPDDFLYVDTVGKAGAWQIRLVGYRPPETLTTGHVRQACANLDGWKPAHSTSPLTDMGAIEPRPADNRPVRWRRSGSADRSLHVLEDHGAEAVQFCAAEFMRVAPGFLGVNMLIVDDPSEFWAEGSPPMDFQEGTKFDAWFISAMGAFAVWPMTTPLTELAVDNRRFPEGWVLR